MSAPDPRSSHNRQKYFVLLPKSFFYHFLSLKKSLLSLVCLLFLLLHISLWDVIDFSIWLGIIAIYTLYIFEENMLLEVAYQSVRKRVAAVLIKLNNQSDLADKDESITVARKDLSGLVGTTTESLNRTIVDFKNVKG